MSGGFSSDAFLKFSKPASDPTCSSGYLDLLHNHERVPYHSISKYSETLSKSGLFLLSPICLSGSQNMDFEAEIEQGSIADSHFDGGFLQSRTESKKGARFISSDKWLANIDYRTNYRLPLDQTLDELLKSMKRDSRSRVRKTLSKIDNFSLSSAASDNNAIKAFSDLYAITATRLNFAPAYQFSFAQWQALLADDCWRLYMLSLDDRVIGGSVVCELDEGFDYTFTAYDPDYPEAARAIIVMLFLLLGSETPSFLELGGGIAEGDALASFKESMGGVPVAFERMRFVNAASSRGGNSERAEIYLSKRWP